MKIFVTGMTGFVGKRLQAKLADEHELDTYALVRSNGAPLHPRINSIFGSLASLRSDDFPEDIDIVIHMASSLDFSLLINQMEQTMSKQLDDSWRSRNGKVSARSSISGRHLVASASLIRPIQSRSSTARSRNRRGPTQRQDCRQKLGFGCSQFVFSNGFDKTSVDMASVGRLHS